MNGFWDEHNDSFFGYKLPESVSALGEAVRAVWQDQYPRLLSFNAPGFVHSCEAAGFLPIECFVEARIERGGVWNRDWDKALETIPNPLAMSLRDAIEQALAANAASVFVDALRPLVESGEGVSRRAALYLLAKKPV